ncbi:hypothetical protein OG21DRAFT_1495015, partial [Imleria badia]
MSFKARQRTKKGEQMDAINEATTMKDNDSKTIQSVILTRTQELSEKSSAEERKQAKPIEIDGGNYIRSVAFLVDGKHIVSGGEDRQIRGWRVEDGEEVGMPMEAPRPVMDIAVSRDGKWIVSGTKGGWVTVWNAESREKVTEFKGHHVSPLSVDVSPDGTRIATGSQDKAVCVWSLSTGQQLLGPLKHDDWVVAAKFSPDGCLIATAAKYRDSIRVYDSQNGHLLVNAPIQVNSNALNKPLAWASDAKKLFVLSYDGNINCLDASTGTTLSKWPIHTGQTGGCIAIANNGMFIAASAGWSVSFWNTTTHEQIGPVIEFTHDVWSMAISVNDDLVICGKKSITLRSLCDILPSDVIQDDSPDEQEHPIQLAKSQKNADQEKDGLKQSLRAEEGSSSNNARLEKNVKELRNELAESERAANEQMDHLCELIGSLRADLETQRMSSNNKIAHLQQQNQELRVQLADSRHKRDDTANRVAHLERINQQLRVQLAECQQKADRLIRIIRAHEQKHHCESLYAQGRIYDVVDTLREIANTVDEDARANKLIVDWLAEFMHRCVMMLERVGDEESNTDKRDEALAAYSAALLLNPSNPKSVLTKWARMVLIGGSTDEALSAAAKFKLPRVVVYRVICDILEGDGRISEAIECFQRMNNELPEDTGMEDERAQWEVEFRGHYVEKLEKLGDTARDSTKHDEVIEYYSNALSLDPTNHNILLKRSNELIELDPSSHGGYEEKHTALHGMGRHSEAFEAFNTMLSKLEQSPDPQIRELRPQYVDATSAIRKAVEKTIRDMPRVLIDTVTGRLYDKTQQAAAFEELTIFDELRSSMTTCTRLDDARIQKEVEKFYRYVMLSHKWQPNEPTFQMVENTSIYVLPVSLTNSKVQRFCELVRYLEFQWAWSDTCCVNQLDKGVQQESLVAMFRWYRGSSLIVVHLLGVLSGSQEVGHLWRSIWNTRGWTYQEYLASEVVQFYTEDWKPYLGLDVFNHKESTTILSEMAQAMNFATQELATLQPGLDKAREKLYLASMRQTTREEDIAYSLFGIFNVAIPIIYGEGNQAVGRLLEHILTRSDNVTLLAWTGHSGSHHSYLPADLTVYNQIVPPHVPSPIEAAE